MLNFILRMTYRHLNDIKEDYVIIQTDVCDTLSEKEKLNYDFFVFFYTEWKRKVKVKLWFLCFLLHINCTHTELKNGRRVILGNGIMY